MLHKTETPTVAKAPRRTQAARTAETRAKLIDAAVGVLYAQGYAGTTIAAVADAAGVSRGGMLHHFEAKDDLIAAVVDFVLGETQAFFRDRIDTIADPRERFLSLPQVAWELFRQPRYLAWIEIWMATRADPQARRIFHAANDAVEQQFRGAVQRFATEAGVARTVDVGALHLLAKSAMTGLAVTATVEGESDAQEGAVRVLRQMLEAMLERDAEPR